MPLFVLGRERLALAARTFVGTPTHLSNEPYYRLREADDCGQKSNDLGYVHRHHLPSRVRRCPRYVVWPLSRGVLVPPTPHAISAAPAYSACGRASRRWGRPATTTLDLGRSLSVMYDVARLMFFSTRPVAGVLLWQGFGLRLQLCTHPRRGAATRPSRPTFLVHAASLGGYNRPSGRLRVGT